MRRADRDEITRSVSEEHSVGSVMCGDGVHHCVNNKATRRYSALKFRPRVHQVVVECCCWVFLHVKGCICWADWLEDMCIGFLRRMGVVVISCQLNSIGD